MFFRRYGLWPRDSELEAFDRTIKRTAIVKTSVQKLPEPTKKQANSAGD
jgi:hypothetical protein